jgi:hypothetical protein
MGWSSKKAGVFGNMGNSIPEMVMTGCDWEKEYEQDGEPWNLLVNSIFQKSLNATCFFDAAWCFICSEFVMILVDFRLLGRNIILLLTGPINALCHYVAFADAMNICRYPQIHTSSYIHTCVCLKMGYCTPKFHSEFSILNGSVTLVKFWWDTPFSP